MMNQMDLELSAGNLFDGGWRSYDRDDLIYAYNLDQDTADSLCEELKKIEEDNA